MESLKRKELSSSSSSSDEDPGPSSSATDPLGDIARAIAESLKMAKKAKKTKKRKKAPDDEPLKTGRVCSICGKPKSNRKGEGNLHYTYVRKGMPAFFYCPAKYSALYGTPPTMTFAEFKTSEHWLPAVEEVHQKKMEKERKKAEAARKRQDKGWRKPGGPRKG